MELNRITDFKWVINPTGSMRVPAYVFASEALLDKMRSDLTLKQLTNIASLPGVFSHVACMPDGHQGYGFPIGGVAALDYHEGGISPGGVGYDINCGVRLMRTGLTINEVKPKIKELMRQLFSNVPAGLGVKGVISVSDSELNKVLNDGVDWALRNGYAISSDVNHTEDKGHLIGDYSLVSDKAKRRARNQLGSLGAGNHFLEVQVVSELFDESIARAFGLSSDEVTIMIHSGSRGLGHQVCSDYLRAIEKKHKLPVPDRELVYAPSGSKLADEYFLAMNSAANFAWVNRQLITHQVRTVFKKLFGVESELVYDVCHNICKIEEFNGKKLFVHRKGATRCAPKGHPLVPRDYVSVGQPVILPGTMGTSSYVLVGLDKSINESFMSTAHGAGRILSRHSAVKSLTTTAVKESMSGIELMAHSSRGVLEEAPQAYKDVDEVVRASVGAGIVKKIIKLKPIGVIKG